MERRDLVRNLPTLELFAKHRQQPVKKRNPPVSPLYKGGLCLKTVILSREATNPDGIGVGRGSRG